MAVSEPGMLGCGRDVDAVLDAAGTPADAHEQTCPYCQQARASAVRLRSVADELRAEHPMEPDAAPSARLKRSVMEIARAEVRRGRTLPLRRPAQGAAAELTISEQVVAGVIRAAADQTPGVRARRCTVRVVPTGLDGGGSDVGAPVTIEVSLGLAVASEVSLPTTVEALRDRVRQAVRDATGLATARVDVRVEDLFDA